jgi:hypothetical protein
MVFCSSSLNALILHLTFNLFNFMSQHFLVYPTVNFKEFHFFVFIVYLQLK